MQKIFYKIIITFLLATISCNLYSQISESHPLPDMPALPPGPKLYLKYSDSLLKYLDSFTLKIGISGQTWSTKSDWPKNSQISKSKEVGAIPKSGGYRIWARIKGHKMDSLIVQFPESGTAYYTSAQRFVGVILPPHDSLKWRIVVRPWNQNEDGLIKEKIHNKKNTQVADSSLEFINPQISFSNDSLGDKCKEQIRAMRDKSIVYPGDTLWFTAYLLASRGTTTSNNLHVEVYKNLKLNPIDSSMWQCVDGMTIGQIKCPDTGSYWVRMYSSMSDEEFFSLTVRGKAPEYVVRHLDWDTTLPGLFGGLVTLEKDSLGYFLHKKHSSIRFYSAVVSDTSQPVFLYQTAWKSYNRCKVDTQFLSYDFRIKSPYNYKGQTLNLIYEQKKSRKDLYPKMDSGVIMRLDNVAFYGKNAYLNYQINHGKRGDILLEPINNSRPWENPKNYLVDTVKQKYINLPGLLGLKPLDTAYVSISYQRRNDGEHNRIFRENPYLERFKNVYVFGFDFDKDTPSIWHQTLGDYFNVHPFRVSGPVRWVIDDREAMPIEVQHLDLKKIKFIDFEDYFMDGPEGFYAYGIIILRLDRDSLSSQIKYLPLQGYSQPVKWTTRDRSTLKWIPFSAEEKVYIGENPPFRVQIMAFWYNYPFFLSFDVDK